MEKIRYPMRICSCTCTCFTLFLFYLIEIECSSIQFVLTVKNSVEWVKCIFFKAKNIYFIFGLRDNYRCHVLANEIVAGHDRIINNVPTPAQQKKLCVSGINIWEKNYKRRKNGAISYMILVKSPPVYCMWLYYVIFFKNAEITVPFS